MKNASWFNVAQIALALDSHRLFVAMRNGNYWLCRRNGETKLWKTRPTEFRIPIKAGLKTCGYATDASGYSESLADRPEFYINTGELTSGPIDPSKRA